jgi:hypothetical protein
MTTQEFNTFIKVSQEHYEEVVKTVPSYRKGQAYMNTLHELHPTIYKEIEGSPVDCFINDKKLPLLLNTITKRI